MKYLHTHFIGIPVSQNLCDKVEEARSWMASVYGCKSGYGTPPHITLVPPFALENDFTTRDVIQTALDSLNECSSFFPFEVQVQGFGSFSERTVFAAVKDSDYWQKLHQVFLSNFSRAFPGQVKKSKRIFYPHLTIANRDIPSGTIDTILKHFSQTKLDETFTADSVCLYIRTKNGGWTCGQMLEI